MKDKKTLKITSIIVAVLIAIFCITKILAAGTEFEDGEEWESTAWGYYVVTEDGEVIYSKEEYESKFNSIEQAKKPPVPQAGSRTFSPILGLIISTIN